MRTSLFFIFDSVASEVKAVFMAKNNKLALRMYLSSIDGVNGLDPDDFALYCVAEFDSEVPTSLKPLDGCCLVARGLDEYQPMEDNPVVVEAKPIDVHKWLADHGVKA